MAFTPGSGVDYYGNPAPQKVARRTTIRRKPAPVRTFGGSSGGGGGGSRSYSPPPAPRPVARTNTSGSYTSYSGSRSSGGGGGAPRQMSAPAPGRISGVGGGGGQRNAAPPEPKAPGIQKFLGSDNTYQQSLSDLLKTLQQFKLQNKDSRTDVREAFQTAMERMGVEREDALKALEADFASRGLLNSGLYGDAVSDYNTQYGDRVTDLTKDRNTNLRNLRTEFSNFRDTTKSKRADLRLDAIRRRAEKYGLQG